MAGDIEVSGTSGDITVRDARSRRVQVKVVSGDIRYEGTLGDGGRYDFSTHSGDVRLVVPRDSRAALDVRTFNGDVTTTDLPLMLMPDPDGRRTRRDARTGARRAAGRPRFARRRMRDSMRAPRTRHRAIGAATRMSFERNLERSVERLVESLMRTLGDQFEVIANQFDAGRPRPLHPLPAR